MPDTLPFSGSACPPTEFIDDTIIEVIVAKFRQLLVEATQRSVTSPRDLFALEADLHNTIPRECIDLVTEAVIKAALTNEDVLWRAESVLNTLPYTRMQKSRQSVTIALLGGGEAKVTTPYFLERNPSRSGPKRKQGKRGKSAGRGCYPVLSALGIHERMTPAYASEVTRLVTIFSEDEVREELLRKGVKRSKGAIRRVVRLVGNRALSYRKRQLEQVEGPVSESPVKGKRIGIFLDGGRIRVRLKKPGRRRKNGGKSFRADWREPKAFIIFEIDEQGRKARRGFVRYDATMGDADATFELLASLLRSLNAQEAKVWVIGGDGAKWIWTRAGWLAEQLGFDREKVVEIVDLWHAVGYIWEFAKLKKKWSKEFRHKWVRQQKRHLKRGKPEEVTAAMRNECTGPKRKELKVLAERFYKNRDRMRYDEYRRRKLPCGSGAMESAVRRIINLRLKGPGIFWSLEAAERLLHLRSQRLCGQWDEYMLQLLEPEAFWCSESASAPELRAA